MKRLLKTTTKLSLAVTIVLSTFILTGCGQQPLITGQIDGLGDDSVLISIRPFAFIEEGEFNLEKRNAVMAKNGKFTFDAVPEVPVFLSIIPKTSVALHADGFDFWPASRLINIALNPGEKVTITGNINDKVLDYDITGSRHNEEVSKLRKQELPYDIKIDSIDFLFESGKDIDQESLRQQRRDIVSQKRQLYYNYVDENPDTDLAAFILLRFPDNDFKTYYEKISDNAKEGMFKRYLEDKVTELEIRESIGPGVDAPRFTLKTPEGTELSLTDVKDKYIVLDFWGAWCGWCIKGFPKMKEYYAKYRNKVEFIGIDCGEPYEKWIEALETYDLPWLHVINNEKERVPYRYAIQGYPTKIILDKDYKIVEIFVGEVEDFYNKLDELLK